MTALELITPELIQNRHRKLLQRQPEAEALRLYRCFPHQRGFAGVTWEDKNDVRFEASLMLALVQAFENPQVNVSLFVPKLLEKWAEEQIVVVARQILRLVKQPLDEKVRLKLVDRIKSGFKQLFLDTHLRNEEPLHWVAYGYPAYDPHLPPWLLSGLLGPAVTPEPDVVPV